MKLIQVNIWQGRILRNLLKFLEAEQPDIICMQEVLSSPVKMPAWDIAQSLESIRKVTGLQHAFYAPTWGFRLMDAKVYHGNAILSRYPLLNQQTIFTNGSFEEEVVNNPYLNNVRNAQIARVQAEEGSFTLVNHHAHWEPSAQGSATSVERLQRLATAITSIEGPLVVAGDFNVHPTSEAIQRFEEKTGLRNLTREHKVVKTLSELGHPVEVACDYIFINEAITEQRFEVSNTLVSDHKALIFEFGLS
jgi:endonuclease/exonuclease/phosphatase family metal-dependent hydrolase